MKKLSEITRRDIFDIIRDGFTIKKEFIVGISSLNGATVREEIAEVKMPYWGRLSEIEFLGRLYPLDTMPSRDTRFANVSGDITQHTINNDDWDYCWVFSDSRFALGNGNEDAPLLKFICEMLHPAVRDDKQPWKEYLKKFNELLNPDGYELFEKNHISGRAIYSFREIDHIETDSPIEPIFTALKPIGSGSYAAVYKYYDARYDKWFALKRAKKELDEKELIRFKREYDDMKKLHSPYVVEVFTYDESKKQYSMELMDDTLEKYIANHNSTLNNKQRKKIVLQLLNAYEYIHSKGLLHRDICPKNILIKQYDDVLILKISDFGLVKETESDLTSDSTEIKGYFNDPTLRIEGFKNYQLLHEIYALTQVIVYVMTGKTNFDKITNIQLKNFLQKGTNSDKTQRFQTLAEMRQAFNSCTEVLK